MRFKWLSRYWLGLLLLVSLATLVLWLAVHGKLTLYIHPRYILFTTVMSIIAVVAVVSDFALVSNRPRVFQPARFYRIAGGLLCLSLILGLLKFQPNGLTSSAANSRGINTAAVNVRTNAKVDDLATQNVNYEHFSVKEWASLLSQTSDPKLFVGKRALVSGFVSPTPDNNPNVFYVSRFVITCCAVDARPIGVPVYSPGWQKTYKADEWVQARGAFIANPETIATPIVLEPFELTEIVKPEQPYVYYR